MTPKNNEKDLVKLNINVGGFLPQTRAFLKSLTKTSETDIRKANEKLVEVQESSEEDYTNQKKAKQCFPFPFQSLKKATMNLEEQSQRS